MSPHPRLPGRALRNLSLVAPLLLFGPGAGGQVDREEVPALKQLAEESYAQGDLERAALLYLRVAERLSGSGRAEALVTAAWLQFLEGRRQAAADSLTQALSSQQDVPFDASLYSPEFEQLFAETRSQVEFQHDRRAAEEVQAALGELEAGRDEAAREDLEAALLVDPDRPVALYTLALLDLRAGRRAEATRGFERVVDLTPPEGDAALRAKALAGLGVLFWEASLWREAEGAFREVTELEPENPEGWKNLGLCRQRLGEPEAAAVAYRRALERRPEDPELARHLARALAEDRREDEALDLLSRTLPRHPREPSLWLELGRLQQGRGVHSEAAVSLRRAMELDPDNRLGVAGPAALRLALSLHQLARHRASIEAAKLALGWLPDEAEGWNTLGLAQQALGELSAAVTSLTRATELAPDRAEFANNLGAAYASAGNLDRAAAAFRRALALDPDYATAHRNLEEVEGRTRSPAAAAASPARGKPMAPKKIGLRFADLDYRDLGLRGALVKEVRKKSPAARAGLRKGDLILWIGGYEVQSAKDFFAYLRRNPPRGVLELEFLRDGRPQRASLTLE